MNPSIENPEATIPDLFELGASRVALPPALKPQLTKLVEAMLAEIAATLASGEVSHEQDQR